VLGCDGWFTARVATCGEFDQALKTAEQVNTGAYIEVVTEKYAASPLSMKLHESIKTLYQSGFRSYNAWSCDSSLRLRSKKLGNKWLSMFGDAVDRGEQFVQSGYDGDFRTFARAAQA
jgi:hypothetical protein